MELNFWRNLTFYEKVLKKTDKGTLGQFFFIRLLFVHGANGSLSLVR
jgi:hypothetical protein